MTDKALERYIVGQISPESVTLAAGKAAELLFSGSPRSKVLSILCEMFKITPDLAQDLMNYAFSTIAEDVKAELADEKNLAIMRRLLLYQQALAQSDLATALKALDSQAKIQGLFNDTGKQKAKNQLASLIEAMTEQAAANSEIIDGDVIDDPYDPKALVPDPSIPTELGDEDEDDEDEDEDE